MSTPDDGTEGRPDGDGSSQGVPRSTTRRSTTRRSTTRRSTTRRSTTRRSTTPRSTARRRTVLAAVAVAILSLDAVLLAWTEMAWLTVRTEATGFPLPLSALVAALTTPVLVLAVDAVMPRTSVLFVPLAAWTLTIVGAGLWSPAGAGVLPPDWRAVLLLAAGVLPALIVGMRRPGRYDPVAPPERDAPDG